MYTTTARGCTKPPPFFFFFQIIVGEAVKAGLLNCVLVLFSKEKIPALEERGLNTFVTVMIHKRQRITETANYYRRGVHGHEEERWPCNHEVPSSSPGSGSQIWDFSLAHTFGASTGVVPRKQTRERLV